MSFDINTADIGYVRTKSGKEYFAVSPSVKERLTDRESPRVDAWEVAVYTGEHGKSDILDVENKGRGLSMFVETSEESIHQIFIPFSEIEVVGT